MTIQILSRVKSFGGWQIQFEHASAVNNCTMRCSLYLPPQAEQHAVPLLYWLSGLTCSDENFVQKAGAQQHAATHGVAIVCPDTSPRGEQVPDVAEAYDFGKGAGFYLSATQAPWAEHYHMDKYICQELPSLLQNEFAIDDAIDGRQGIMGHSMGGHGALTLALKNPQCYRSVSAFAPIASPMNCPWGEKALTGYLGANRETWCDYDSCHLIRQASGHKFHLLVEQGMADPFLKEQLKPELLTAACRAADYPLTLNERPDYDHSYFFIASFIGEHIAFHARQLADG